MKYFWCYIFRLQDFWPFMTCFILGYLGNKGMYYESRTTILFKIGPKSFWTGCIVIQFSSTVDFQNFIALKVAMLCCVCRGTKTMQAKLGTIKREMFVPA